MSDEFTRFSDRQSLSPKHDGPLIYNDVPMKVRAEYLTILQTVLDNCSGAVRHCALKVLRQRPNPNHNCTSEDSYYEIAELLQNASWHGVLDVVEAVYSIANDDGYLADGDEYQDAINRLFAEYGIGWKLVSGRLEIRGDDGIEALRDRATKEIDASTYSVAAKELREAWQDLSRRPEPDLSGAVHHAMAALEAVAKEWGGTKDNLGDIIKKRPDMFPPPLNEAVAKLWGFASNNARHGSENRNLVLDEVFLVVGTCATLATYLARKMPEGSNKGAFE